MKILKKAQITIFVILGMIIFILAILFISSENDFDKNNIIEKQNFDSKAAINSVETYVERCLERQTRNALTYTLAQNGYYEMGTANDAPNITILMYIDFYEMDSKYYAFNLSNLNKAVLLYLYDTLPYCLADMNDSLQDLNILFPEETLKLNVVKNSENLRVDLKLPIQINSNGNEFMVEDYTYTLDKVPFDIIENDTNLILDTLFEDVLEHQPQNHTTFNFSNLPEKLPEIFDRNDLFLTILVEPENESIVDSSFIFEYKHPWKKIFVAFKVRDESLHEVGGFDEY